MSKTKELRCIHRHTIKEHPSCFAKGKVKYFFKDEKEFERLTGSPWYTYPGYKIGYFDIETDNLNADFGTVLSWCFKEKGNPKIKSSVITRAELFNGDIDRRVVREFIEEMKNYDIIVGYNSTNFDLPYMRAKALHYGMEFPGFIMKEYSPGKYRSESELYHFDLYYTVKSKLRISRKS